MPQFQYEVKKGPDDRATGTLEAESQQAAVARLRDMGYFPLSVVEHVEPAEKDVLKKAFMRVRLQERNLFFRQLANLIESGMLITRGLRTLSEQSENPKLTRVIEQLRDDVQNGSTFAEALEKHPKIFSPMTTSLVHAGETGGMLEEVLWRIVAFGEQEADLKSKATSATIYPIFLLFVGSVSIFILISFVFPNFVSIFDEFDAVLPLPTRIVMGVSSFMGTWWPLVIIFIGVLVFIFNTYVRTEKGRRNVDARLMRAPVLKGVLQKYEMAKFARTLGTLLDNGVPVLTALRITSDTMSNRVIREEVSVIHAGVTEGESISESMQQTKYFPNMVISMFSVGEESGRIGTVSKRVAEVYDGEVERAVGAATALFEPMLIVAMGVIVGFLVIAMLMPMLTLSSVVAG
jgi:type IV pilus assembly protein PilC